MMLTTVVAGEGKTVRARKFWPHELVLGLLPLLIGFEVLLWTVYLPLETRGIADFRQLYTGGYILRTGHAAELYDYDTQQRLEETLVPVGLHFTQPINHLAFEELLFVPLSLLAYRVAYWVFMAFNVALLILCAGLLRHRFKVLSDRWEWFSAFLIPAFFPISRALQKGQDSIIMLTLLAAALWALDHEKEFVAGLLVGIGIFKFQIVIPIALLFLVWRRWRFSAGFAASSVTAGLVSLWLVGLGGARDYAHMLVSMSLRLSSGADMRRYATDPREMINLRGLFTVIFDGKLAHGYVQFLVAVCSVVVLLAAARQRPSLPLAIAAGSLVSYHLLIHDASIFIIVIAAALCSESVWVGAAAVLLLIAPLCAIVPFYGYLAAIPLLGLFLLMLGRVPERSEFTTGGRQDAIAEGSLCR
jgi:Glycosyltransferase family 87